MNPWVFAILIFALCGAVLVGLLCWACLVVGDWADANISRQVAARTKSESPPSRTPGRTQT